MEGHRDRRSALQPVSQTLTRSSVKGFGKISSVKTVTLSDRAGLLKPSPTLAMTSRAKAMKSQGRDVISFAAGEPDFNTPDEICSAAIQALGEGQTKYCASSGLPQLREVVAEKLTTQNKVATSPDQIIVSCGAKHSIYNTLQVLVNPGDEVILIAPYWMTYFDQVVLAGGTPKVIYATAENDFSPTIEQVKAVVTERTKAIILNSPSNPTGGIIPASTLAAIGQLCVQNGMWIISDEIYERLIYGVEHTSIASLGKEIADQTITITGVSKTYSMTGWRIGFASGPLPVIKAISNFQDQVTSNATTFAQFGAIAALKMPEEEVESMRAEFQIRRDLILAELRKLPDVNVRTPHGAFYVFPDLSAYLGGEISTDLQLAEYLLENAEVATIPGSVFEGNGHLRMSYAASRSDIEDGVQRIGKALSNLRK